MKKYFALGLMIALGFTACQKEDIADATAAGNQNAISHNFTVSPAEWNDGTRTVYEEGVGVQMTGAEEISVYYGDHQYASDSGDAASVLKKVKGTPGEPFTYSFSHDAISGAAAYDYYFVLPNTSTNSQQSKSHRPNVYLNTIQYPTATSFDPAQDYLVGTPKYGVDQSTEFGSINFKRLFAPLRVTLTGIPEGEKVRYATLMQSGECNTMNPLVGTAYLRFEHIEGEGDAKVVSKSEDYADATINSWLSSGYGNKVTAYYGEGLATNAGACDAWYVINPRVRDSENPTTISGDMTYWVVTDNKLITRTVTLPQPIKFSKYLLNKFSFNVTGEDYTEQNALTQDFTTLSSLTNTLTASDGEAHTWNFTGCKIQNKGLYAAANSGATITLPTLPDQKITKILILQGLMNPNNSNTSTLQLMADGVAVGDVSDFNTQRLLTNSDNGYLVIDVPEEYQTSALSLSKPTTDKNVIYISAITLVYEADTTPSVKIDNVTAATDSFNVTVSGKNVAGGFWVLLPAGTPAPELEDFFMYNYVDFEEANPNTFMVNSLPTEPYTLEPDTEYELYFLGIQVDEEWNPVDFALASQTVKTATNEVTVTIGDTVVATANSLTFDVTIQNADMAMYVVLPAGAPEPEMEDLVDGNPIEDFEEGVPYSLKVVNCMGEQGELSPETEYTLYVFACQMEDMENNAVASKTAKTAKAASPVMSYSEMYEAGMTFTIGDLEINQTNYPTAKTVAIADLKNADFVEGGLVFVTGEGSMTMTTSPGCHSGLILVGDNPNVQPEIVMHGSGNFYFATRGTDNIFAFKNLKFEGSTCNYLFSNTDQAAAAGDIAALYIEDCTLISNGSFVQDANSTKSMKKIVVNNNVIKFPNAEDTTGKYVVGAASKKTAKDLSMMNEITVTNNVIYAESPVTQYIVMLGSASQTYETLNVAITVDHNSIYNIYHTNGLLSLYDAKSVDFTYNVLAFDNSSLNKGPYCIGWYDPNNSIEVNVENISAWSNNGSEKKWKSLKKPSGYPTTVHTAGNDFALTTNPFSVTNTTTGYILVDDTVVDNGAGATYDLKKWSTWAE